MQQLYIYPLYLYSRIHDMSSSACVQHQCGCRMLGDLRYDCLYDDCSPPLSLSEMGHKPCRSCTLYFDCLCPLRGVVCTLMYIWLHRLFSNYQQRKQEPPKGNIARIHQLSCITLNSIRPPSSPLIQIDKILPFRQLYFCKSLLLIKHDYIYI